MSGVLKKKVVVVGDGYVGKTSILMVFKDRKFPHEYIPTVFENHVVEHCVSGLRVDLQLVDTAGQEDYDRLRPLSYTHADVIVLCFSVASPASYDHVTLKWIPEVRHHCPRAPVVLVGTKVDLRRDPRLAERSTKVKSEEDGKRLAQSVKAQTYLECSALTQEGIREVFDTAAAAALAGRPRRTRRNCDIF